MRAQEEEAVANGKTADTEVDNDDDAILLLKALAGQDSEVRLTKQTASICQESFLLQHWSLIMCMSQVFARSVHIIPLHKGIHARLAMKRHRLLRICRACVCSSQVREAVKGSEVATANCCVM